jgi:predicted metal-binding protein
VNPPEDVNVIVEVPIGGESINQRAVLKCRGGLVADLYARPAPPHVIALA